MEGDGDSRQKLGRLGEDLACRFLEKEGHEILERNFRSGHFEIDIISFDSRGIHFVEVKTRKSGIQAPPQESVNHAKQKRITAAAQRFLRTRKGLPYGNHECMFDIFTVTFHGDEIITEWIPQAFIPIYV